LRVLADLDKPAVDSGEQAMASLTAPEVQTLIALLQRIRAGLL